MEQDEFFDLVKTKQMKEAHITMICGCELLYAPLLKEVLAKPCPLHESSM